MPAPNDAPDPPEPPQPESPPPSEEQGSVRVRWLASDRAQTLANVLTIIVALAAIGLSMWEGIENRRHNRLSVLPHLESDFLIDSDSDSTFTVRLLLENTGLGPAVLQNIVHFKDGEKVYDAKQPDTPYSLYRDIEHEMDALPFGYGSLGTLGLGVGEMLQAGAEHRFVGVTALRPDTISVLQAVSVMRDSVFAGRSFVFCYCSVYGEDCDVAHLGEPPEADVCEF